jgi:hypothetical protein
MTLCATIVYECPTWSSGGHSRRGRTWRRDGALLQSIKVAFGRNTFSGSSLWKGRTGRIRFPPWRWLSSGTPQGHGWAACSAVLVVYRGGESSIWMDTTEGGCRASQVFRSIMLSTQILNMHFSVPHHDAMSIFYIGPDSEMSPKSHLHGITRLPVIALLLLPS